MQENLNISVNMPNQEEILCKYTNVTNSNYHYVNEQTCTPIGRFTFYIDINRPLPTNYEINLLDKCNKATTINAQCACEYLEASQGSFKTNVYDCKLKTMRKECVNVRAVSAVVNLNEYAFDSKEKIDEYIINSSERNCDEMCGPYYPRSLNSYNENTSVAINTEQYNYNGNECLNPTIATYVTYMDNKSSRAIIALLLLSIFKGLYYIVKLYREEHEVLPHIIMEMQPFPPVIENEEV